MFCMIVLIHYERLDFIFCMFIIGVSVRLFIGVFLVVVVYITVDSFVTSYYRRFCVLVTTYYILYVVFCSFTINCLVLVIQGPCFKYLFIGRTQKMIITTCTQSY